MRKSRTLLLLQMRLDASHRATDRETHPTHWPAADHRNFPRVRSGCAGVGLSAPRNIPWLSADTRRMRMEDRL